MFVLLLGESCWRSLYLDDRETLSGDVDKPSNNLQLLANVYEAPLYHKTDGYQQRWATQILSGRHCFFCGVAPCALRANKEAGLSLVLFFLADACAEAMRQRFRPT